MPTEFLIFAGEFVDDVSRRILGQMKQKIDGEDANYLLNVNETEYLEHLTSQFDLGPLDIRVDDVFATQKEVMVKGEHFPGGGVLFAVDPGRSYARHAITYHVPFEGDESLLRYKPSSYFPNARKVRIENGCICFDVVDFYGDPARIKGDADYVLSRIRDSGATINQDIEQHNRSIRTERQMMIQQRKSELLRRQNLAAALGVPIRRSANVPATFTVPTVRKKVLAKPHAPTDHYIPEPTLDQDVYREILQTIHDTGQVFERLPSTYADKCEEDLRDHLILQLEPRFEGSTTGETFNKSGKTDILIRHDKRNIFVGECKFWGGEKLHLKTIDQILSYLTWRDSKAAIVYFVQSKTITSALSAIESSTPTHLCFVAAKGKVEESWFTYEFHLPHDPSRSVQLTVLCFHLPSR